MDLKSLLSKWKGIEKIGKDRLVILFVAGILLLVIATPVSQYSKLASGTKEEKETETKSNGAAQNTEKKTYDINTWENDSDSLSNDAYVEEMENKLKQVLSKINGVGKTEVIITVESSKELVVEKDQPYTRDNLNETDAEGGSRVTTNMTDEENTVYVKDGDGNEIPFVSKEINPEITGVLVVCQGGGNEQVKKEITESLQALFHLDVHKIKVAKMNIK